MKNFQEKAVEFIMTSHILVRIKDQIVSSSNWRR